MKTSKHADDVSATKHLVRMLPEMAPATVFSNFDDAWIPRKANCACGGGCPACQPKSSDLRVSQPNDRAEIEADQIADRVMRMPVNDEKPIGQVGIQNQTSVKTIQRKCRGCEEDDETKIQRRALRSDGVIPSQSRAHVRSVIGSGGQPLDLQTRGFFEQRLGYDLSRVRVHTGSAAGQSARAIDARAYTINNNIVFGSGSYDPASFEGRRLIAHELAHVVQASDGAPAPIRREIADGGEAATTDVPATTDAPVPLDKPNRAPSCDEVCGNSADKCIQGPGEHCSDEMSKKVGKAWANAASQLAGAIDALAESPLSAATLASLKSNFNWSPGNAPADLPAKVSANLSTAATKMSDNLCIKCLSECPAGAVAQITRARGVNCLGSNCFTICPAFTEKDTHVLLHELFHRVVTPVEDLYRGQTGYPPPPSMALKLPDSHASLIDDTNAAAAAKAKAKSGTNTP